MGVSVVSVEPRLALALEQLAAAAGDLDTPATFEDHAAQIPVAVEALSRFYLHIDAQTGKYDAAPIYLDKSRIVFGLLPGAIAPLLDLLSVQTDRLAALPQLPQLSVLPFKRWQQRLAHYRAVVTQELALGAYKPSERLFDKVTKPLMQGLYGPEFASMGIVNPDVPSKPDVTTVATETFVVALESQLVSDTQKWLLGWTNAVNEWRSAMSGAISAAMAELGERVEAAVTRTALWIGGGLLLAGGLWWWWSANQQREPERLYLR